MSMIVPFSLISTVHEANLFADAVFVVVVVV